MLQPILSKLTNSSITAGCHINSTKMIWILSLVICLRWWIFFFFFEISILVTKNQHHSSIIASSLSVPQESKLALMATRLNLSSAFRATPEKALWHRFSSSILMQKRSSTIIANLQYHHYKRQLPLTGHFISSDDLVFAISFPFWSTHQHSPLEDWHCTSSYRPSSLHRGINRFWESWNGAFRYLRWQEVTAPPEKQANEETDNSVNE